jgi:hypothetical protein
MTTPPPIDKKSHVIAWVATLPADDRRLAVIDKMRLGIEAEPPERLLSLKDLRLEIQKHCGHRFLAHAQSLLDAEAFARERLLRVAMSPSVRPNARAWSITFVGMANVVLEHALSFCEAVTNACSDRTPCCNRGGAVLAKRASIRPNV